MTQRVKSIGSRTLAISLTLVSENDICLGALAMERRDCSNNYATSQSIYVMAVMQSRDLVSPSLW